MNMGRTSTIAFLIGRFIVGGVYLYSGVDNLIELPGKAGYAASKGLPIPQLFIIAASVLLILGGLSLWTGMWTRLGLAAIVLFLIPVTLIMHNFWALQGVEQIIEFHNFQANLGLMGSALMFLAIPEPWAYSMPRPVAAQGAALRPTKG
jgi:putative oxidoreductase